MPANAAGPIEAITGVVRVKISVGADWVKYNLPDNPGTGPALGNGCAWRDPFPPYFSKYVLGHELGHYFGLTHAGHPGIEDIMFSIAAPGASIVDANSWRLWLHGDPCFNETDVENTWRFIVKKLPHVLQAL